MCDLELNHRTIAFNITVNYQKAIVSLQISQQKLFLYKKKKKKKKKKIADRTWDRTRTRPNLQQVQVGLANRVASTINNEND